MFDNLQFSSYCSCGNLFLLYDKKFGFLSDKMLLYGGNKLIKHLSLNSFGIYVFHMLWVNVLYKVIKFNPFDYGLWILLPMLIALLVASDITTSIFRKVPFVGKFI